MYTRRKVFSIIEIDGEERLFSVNETSLLKEEEQKEFGNPENKAAKNAYYRQLGAGGSNNYGCRALWRAVISIPKAIHSAIDINNDRWLTDSSLYGKPKGISEDDYKKIEDDHNIVNALLVNRGRRMSRAN